MDLTLAILPTVAAVWLTTAGRASTDQASRSLAPPAVPALIVAFGTIRRLRRMSAWTAGGFGVEQFQD